VYINNSNIYKDLSINQLMLKCPNCRSSKMTENEKGEKSCKNCTYLWKPNTLIKLQKNQKEVKIL